MTLVAAYALGLSSLLLCSSFAMSPICITSGFNMRSTPSSTTLGRLLLTNDMSDVANGLPNKSAHRKAETSNINASQGPLHTRQTLKILAYCT
ncbi:hypothetical protein JOL62DRAFT_637001 [Phyllosticta paracitricarpa]|uniref:Secreted protein n=1 Tax=Phyllosticta paracitricarpa TaxID=2016321 RepID=A0ABR1NE46_9PEZI